MRLIRGPWTLGSRKEELEHLQNLWGLALTFIQALERSSSEERGNTVCVLNIRSTKENTLKILFPFLSPATHFLSLEITSDTIALCIFPEVFHGQRIKFSLCCGLSLASTEAYYTNSFESFSPLYVSLVSVLRHTQLTCSFEQLQSIPLLRCNIIYLPGFNG